MSKPDPKMDHYTIACGAIPYHYELFFEPNLSTFEFIGKTTIKLRAEKPIKSIKLNSKELKITSAVLTIAGKSQVQEVHFTLDNSSEATFKFSSPVKGEFELAIDYVGAHNDRLYGFYRSSYRHNGKTSHMLSTQFEAPNARAAFPCLDEPEFKATFDVSMLIDSELEAISNMPIKETKLLPTEGIGKKKLVTFETSPKMSTYLLYLAVGNFDQVRGSVGKVKINVFATPGKNAYVDLPLDYSKRLFADLQTYFGIDYPLPKLDFLAIPDFAAGAMENWGAIAFRETALLGNELETTVAGKQRIAEVVSHEIAHMWFGDLVTMLWWDDMWLNESFATFMEYKSVDRVFPQWKAMLKYYLDSVGTAMVADGMVNTHPISVKVNTAGEISELFDAIGYHKGGSVLLMLEDFVGPEIFQKGLTRYLKKHSYANATKSDLWAAIADECEAQGKNYPIIAIMEDWINREGYPIVNVRESGEGVFILDQERFTISGNKKGSVWKIPISYLSEKGEGKILMDNPTAQITNAGKWIKLNYKQAGFYRVNYQSRNLVELGKLIKEKTLSGLDVWGIENDLFAFVRSGQMPLTEYLEFVKNFCSECQYPADVNISGHLGWLNSVAYGQEFVKGAKKLSLSLHEKILGRLGWVVDPKESSIDTKLRSIAISELCFLGDPEAVRKAKSLFDGLMEKGQILNPNLKRAVYSAVAFNKPDQQTFSKFLGIYQGSGSPEDKIIALSAIGSFGERGLLAKALDLSQSKEVRLQDSVILTSGVASNPLDRQIYRNWAMKNWHSLMVKYDPSSHMLKNCVGGFGMLADRKSLFELESFFSDKSNLRDDIKIEVKQTLERISANIKFIERNS
ncbi:M1 family metallopeptidase [Candidatus Micrarchaeota archaeon]|nr:M1 family metallopeptidase [Candidatus Micrarchaeota archaeon]